MKKDKKVIFSEEIDSSIAGFALGISFVILAGLVYYFDFFHLRIADRIVSVLLLIFGICGTCIEIGRINGEKIKGKDDLLLGLFLTIPALVLIIKYNQILLNIICFIVLLLSLFVTFKGIMNSIYIPHLKWGPRQSRGVT